MAFSRLIVQIIRNRNLNPVWLRALRIIASRAMIDPDYADRIGCVLTGLTLAVGTLGLGVAARTVEQAIVSARPGTPWGRPGRRSQSPRPAPGISGRRISPSPGSGTGRSRRRGGAPKPSMAMAFIACSFLPAGSRSRIRTLSRSWPARWPGDVGLGDDPGRPAGPLAVQHGQAGRAGVLHQVARRGRVIVEMDDWGGCRCRHGISPSLA
jgi:hypothetical protein